ncbi:MAG TPA: hypothetical protein VJQ85_05275 [Gaiellaceae bacterium]|nr:hypothetical protein [Gaiellaceae bacterium]
MNAQREPQYCPRCGVAYEPLQEYCLECGERLPTNRGTVGVLAAAWQRRIPWYPGDWIWPALLFLVVAVVATAVSAATTSSSGTTIVATQPHVTVGSGSSGGAGPSPTSTLPAAPQPTVTTAALPQAPGAPTTTASNPSIPRAAGLFAWPATATAYTDVLESVPFTSGRTAALTRARQAKAAGLPKAGVLVSADYPSLRPGYYVVFSGVYPTPAAATAGLSSAHVRGFPDAYVARVTHP